MIIIARIWRCFSIANDLFFSIKEGLELAETDKLDEAKKMAARLAVVLLECRGEGERALSRAAR